MTEYKVKYTIANTLIILLFLIVTFENAEADSKPNIRDKKITASKLFDALKGTWCGEVDVQEPFVGKRKLSIDFDIEKIDGKPSMKIFHEIVSETKNPKRPQISQSI